MSSLTGHDDDLEEALGLTEAEEEFDKIGHEKAGLAKSVDVKRAYFIGEEAVGGNQAIPDRNVVAEIACAGGLLYKDAKPLTSTDKVNERDRRRWELEPASSSED